MKKVAMPLLISIAIISSTLTACGESQDVKNENGNIGCPQLAKGSNGREII